MAQEPKRKDNWEEAEYEILDFDPVIKREVLAQT